jgi:predicted ATP-grasp superfamily ATP-dependent carboligase
VRDPSELYRLEPDRPALGSPVLVVVLSGFVDAGGAARLARGHLLSMLEHRVVATFDVDALVDYRARRPPMLFVEDHWERYEAPELVVRLLHDTSGTPFLLLDGPEPDVRWEQFVAAVTQVVDRLGVRLTIGVTAIPMAVPHTRPVAITAHGSRRELVAGHEPWVGTVQVPGSAANLLEYRLGTSGHDAMGFAVHVPHYVAQLELPQAAAAVLDAVGRAGRLSLPTDALHQAGVRTQAEIDEQVARSPEIAAVVTALEEQYDEAVAARGTARIPTADELGAELERFLAQQQRPDEGQPGPGPASGPA